MNPSLLRVWRSWASCRSARVNQPAIARIYCVVGLCLVHLKSTLVHLLQFLCTFYLSRSSPLTEFRKLASRSSHRRSAHYALRVLT
jgi:hypothetical protein